MKRPTGKLSIYIPQKKMGKRLVEKLDVIGDLEDRSANYLVVAAIEDYVEKFEQENGPIQLEAE